MPSKVEHLLLHLLRVLPDHQRTLAALRNQTSRGEEGVILPLGDSGITWWQIVVVAESCELCLHQVSDGARHNLYYLAREQG